MCVGWFFFARSWSSSSSRHASIAAYDLFHENEPRARTIMRTLMTLMPEDAVVVAAKLASGVDAKAIIEATIEQTHAIRKAARVAARKRPKAKAVDKPKEAGE